MDKVRLKGLTAKIEAEYKTDIVPTIADDGIQVEEDLWGEIEWGYLEENLRENLAHLGFGRAGLSVPAGPFLRVRSTVAVKGLGAAYAAVGELELSALLNSAGLTESVDATEGTEYLQFVPSSSVFESASIYAYSANSLFKGVGGRSIIQEIQIIPGQIALIRFETFAVLTSITDIALPTIVYPLKAILPPVVKAAGFTMGSYDPSDFASFRFEQRLELPARPRGNDADGHAGYEPVDYDPHFITVVEKPPLASFDWWAHRKDRTPFAWDINVGATQYNKLTLSGPAGVIVGAPHSDTDGFAMLDFLVRCQHTNEEAEDAFKLLFD